MDEFFSGSELYGDSFSQSDIEQWYKDEAEAYAELVNEKKSVYSYDYHALNDYHGYSHVKRIRFRHVLGLGSAYGDELLKIIDKVDEISILDPSEKFSQTQEIYGKPCRYFRPDESGAMPFNENQYDLITCFGVLHHIPNVTKVMEECSRCITKGGYMLIREPIISMGDWRKKRTGLTKRERGIPLEIMLGIADDVGFDIEYKSVCMFPLIAKVAAKLSIKTYNNIFLTKLDKILSKLFLWNYRYHRTRFFHKFAPCSVFIVLKKN